MATMTLLQSSFISPIKHNQRTEMGLSGLPPGSFYFFIFTFSKVLHPCLLLFGVIPHFFASYGSTTFFLRLFSHFNTKTFSHFYCKNYDFEMLVFITAVVFHMTLLHCDSHAGRNTSSFIETPLSSLYLPFQSCLFWPYIVLNYWYASLKNPCDPSVPWSHKVKTKNWCNEYRSAELMLVKVQTTFEWVWSKAVLTKKNYLHYFQCLNNLSEVTNKNTNFATISWKIIDAFNDTFNYFFYFEIHRQFTHQLFWGFVIVVF